LSDENESRTPVSDGRLPDDRGLRAILNAIPQMVWSTRPDGHHDFYNDRWYEFTGVPPGSTDGEAWNGMFHPDDRERAWARWRRSLETGEPYEIEYRLRHRSGAYRWMLGRALPSRGADGAIERWFGTCTDIDTHRRVEDERAKLAAVAEQSRHFVAIVGVDGRLQYLNEAGRRLAGLVGAALCGVTMESCLTPESVATFRGEVLPAVDASGAWEGELSLRDAGTGAAMPALYSIYPVRDGEGRLIGYATTARDVSDLERASETQLLIARELSHRMKNLFAVVSGLVVLSARAVPEAQDFAASVSARIDALGQAHAALWSDGTRPGNGIEPGEATVQALAARLLLPYRAGTDSRVAIGGEDAPVGIQAATALALLLHELATNALKHGALSAPAGAVALHGRRRGGDYELVWRESGGPAVAGPPARSGFGLAMLDRVATAQLGARIERDWRPDGLVVRFVAPLAGIAR
jgi:PAS domain S-box-containing protein